MNLDDKNSGTSLSRDETTAPSDELNSDQSDDSKPTNIILNCSFIVFLGSQSPLAPLQTNWPRVWGCQDYKELI